MEPAFITPTLKQRGIALLKVAIPLTAFLLIAPASRFYSDQTACLSSCEQLPWVRSVVVFGVVVLTLLAYISCRGGIKIWRSGQFPAPGTAVLFRKPIQTGWRARLNAITLFVFAISSATALAFFLKFFIFSEAGMFIVGLSRCGPNNSFKPKPLRGSA
ncbi:hypothetical protein ACFPOA_03170 [Lysobacter niabensis]|uniref:hypothetical protein n=1 Tax=Agrilutibacter niabensis TaxID=380628 RepID=UPI00361F6E2A